MSSGNNSPSAAALPRFRLRGDIRVSTAEDGSFVLEDPRQGKFYRLGPAEYSVVAQLDGQTDLRYALLRAANCRDGQQPTAERFAQLQAWLAASSLVETESGAGPRDSVQPAPALPSFNPCYFRYSLGAPTRLLMSLERALGWLFTLPAMITVVLVSLGAAPFVFQRWEKLTASLHGILCPDQHLPLLGCWLLLKTAHEIGHGLACRRLGGEVREWGLAFIYLMPVPYTDVTSSWRLSSRYDRMAVAAAGMYVEWILALVALFVWSCSASAAVQHLCVYTISLATVTTVLFNANPLCRLDGYYIVSDWLGWPNLAAQAQRLAGSLLQRLIGGASGGQSNLSGRQYWLLLAYGLAAAVWRWVSLLSMGVVVLLVYEGLGALLIAGALLAWYGPSLSSPTSSAKLLSWLRQPAAIARLALIVGACAAIGYWLPWPFPITAPGIVESSAQHTIRTRAAGQVVELLVADGEWVEEGQDLLVLRNDELTFELRNLELALEHGETKLRSLHTKRQLVDYQVQQQRQETLALQIAEQRRRIDGLTLKSPAAGRVLARRLTDLPGSFLKEGTEVCTIAETGLKFRLSIAESELPDFVAQRGRSIDIRLPNRTFSGTLASFEPQASTALFDPALGATAGGPLPVAASAGSRERGDTQAWQLLKPRVTGTITLSANDWAALRAGERGSAVLQPQGRTFATAGWALGTEWLSGMRQKVQSREQH